MEHLFNSVLLVDNMPDVLAVTQLFLESVGLEVHTAHNAKEAIDLYGALQNARRVPNVAIIDAAIGDGDDGFTLSADILKLDKQRQTTTFIYTAYGVERAKLLAIGSGAESIIDKMKVGDALLAEIDAGLRNKTRRQERVMRAPGQFGGSWFSNREMAVYALNLLFFLAVAWCLGSINAHYKDQAAGVARIEDSLKQDLKALNVKIENEQGTRSMSFNSLDGSIKEVKGALGQINKGK